ncbi:MAG: copper chaperone PCu(A)C [Pseudorhodobacter sp.]
MRNVFCGLMLLGALMAAGAFIPRASAEQIEAGELVLSGIFARATPPSAATGAAYLTIANNGAEDDRLISATTAAGQEVQIHQVEEVDDVMTMRQLPDGVLIPAGGSVVLEPGGIHLMIMGLSGPLNKGEALDMVLTFERAGEVNVNIDILAIGARSAPAEDSKP